MSESDREERIRRRAFELYEQRGGEEGRDQEDWLSAEEELFHSPGASRPQDQPASPNSEDAQTPLDTNHKKDNKINAAAEESFPASDAPAWRGGTSA